MEVDEASDQTLNWAFNPLYTGNTETDIFTNSDDPDETPHNPRVYTVKVIKIFRQKLQYLKNT